MNASLAMGKVPMMLKLAHIRPIFKAGDPETAKNYRPISLLPVVSKILERIVHKRLCVLLTEHDLLPAEQFAYRAHHSTEDAVLLAVDQFYEAADQHLHTGVVLIDMSKAFDKVQHQTLLQDLFELRYLLYGTGLVCGLPQRTTPVCGHCQRYTLRGNSLHVRCPPGKRAWSDIIRDLHEMCRISS
eukprot:scpid79624/ scgid23187/ Probable RNA-directed DNA polymerase from transposon X-element; Reverse transcriptase